MASFEQKEKERLDYTMKRFEDFCKEVLKYNETQDTNKLFARIREFEDKVEKLNVRVLNLENRLKDRDD